MIRLVVADGDLDLAQDGMSLEILNPFFQENSIPGITSLPFGLGMTRGNVAKLGAPHQYRGAGTPPPPVCDAYIDGPLWKRGSLVYRECDEAGQKYTVTFAADATDLQKRVQDVKLTSLDLGTVPFVRSATQADYALVSVANAAFYGDKQPQYTGVVNYYGPNVAGGSAGGVEGYAAGVYTGATTFVPMPRLMPVFRRVMAAFGYTIVGEWMDDEELQRLVIYSDRNVDDLAGPDGTAATVVLARHLPDITVAEFLIALQQLFCLGFEFNAKRGELRITPLRDVVRRTGTYVDRRPLRRVRTKPNGTDGWLLKQEPDSNDELDKTRDASWQQLRLGNGKGVIGVKAGTLHMVQHADALAGTDRLYPAIEAKGASVAHELGDDSRTGLRLLFDRGMQPDGAGNLYPFGSAGTTNLTGQEVGEYSLLWDGPKGLYQTWWKPWLDFRSREVTVEYDVEFGLADLLMLSPAMHEMLDHHLHFWERVSLTIDPRRRLSKARITYRELL